MNSEGLPVEIVSIFGDLSAYMLIPHIEKNPSIKGRDLEELMPYVCAGEVDSAKKFVRAIKGYSTLCPVLFSDSTFQAGKLMLIAVKYLLQL